MVGKSESGQSPYWARPCPADLISWLDLGTACYFCPAQVAFFGHDLLSCLDTMGLWPLLVKITAPASLVGRLVSWLTSLCEAACFCCVMEQWEQGCSLTDSKQGVEGGHNTGWEQWPNWEGAEWWQYRQFRDSIQAQSRVQIVRQVCGEEAGARSSQEVNLQVRVRIRSGNHNLDQTQSSDQQAGPLWWGRFKIKPGSQSADQGPD